MRQTKATIRQAFLSTLLEYFRNKKRKWFCYSGENFQRITIEQDVIAETNFAIKTLYLKKRPLSISLLQ